MSLLKRDRLAAVVFTMLVIPLLGGNLHAQVCPNGGGGASAGAGAGAGAGTADTAPGGRSGSTAMENLARFQQAQQFVQFMQGIRRSQQQANGFGHRDRSRPNSGRRGERAPLASAEGSRSDSVDADDSESLPAASNVRGLSPRQRSRLRRERRQAEQRKVNEVRRARRKAALQRSAAAEVASNP